MEVTSLKNFIHSFYNSNQIKCSFVCVKSREHLVSHVHSDEIFYEGQSKFLPGLLFLVDKVKGSLQAQLFWCWEPIDEIWASDQEASWMPHPVDIHLGRNLAAHSLRNNISYRVWNASGPSSTYFVTSANQNLINSGKRGRLEELNETFYFFNVLFRLLVIGQTHESLETFYTISAITNYSNCQVSFTL